MCSIFVSCTSKFNINIVTNKKYWLINIRKGSNIYYQNIFLLTDLCKRLCMSSRIHKSLWNRSNLHDKSGMLPNSRIKNNWQSCKNWKEWKYRLSFLSPSSNAKIQTYEKEIKKAFKILFLNSIDIQWESKLYKKCIFVYLFQL